MPERLDESVMAMVAAREFFDGAVVNLGIGLPLAAARTRCPPATRCSSTPSTACSASARSPANARDVDPLVMQVGSTPVESRPGMSFMSHDESFAMVRGGHIDITVLGALQVDVEGNLANAQLPGKIAGNLGGAPDLAGRAKRCIVLTHHTTSGGAPKLVERCTLPLTAPSCVARVVTDVAVIDVVGGRFVLRELGAGLDAGRCAGDHGRAADNGQERVSDRPGLN